MGRLRLRQGLTARPHRQVVLASDGDPVAREGFEPEIAFTTDDMVTIQALVAAGLGVATTTGLALRAHHHPDVKAYEIPKADRHVYVATHGEPPDPPATAALVDVLVSLA